MPTMMTTTSRLVCGPYRRVLEPAFIQLIAKLPRKDPLAPLPIVIPSNAVARRLKTVLAASGSSNGFLNIEWLTILDVAKRLWREVPPSAVEMQPEVKRLIGAALMGRVVEEEIGAGSYFAGVKDFVGFARGLAGCLRDLKEAGIRPQDLVSLRNLPPKVAEIGRLYAAHERQLAECGVIEDEDILRAAAVACRGSDTARSGAAAGAAAMSPWLAARPALVLYGLYDPTPLQRALIEAIARCVTLWAFAPVEPGHPACRYAEPTIAWLRGLLGTEASAASDADATSDVDPMLDELASALFVADCQTQTAVGSRQKAEGSKQPESASCLLPPAYSVTAVQLEKAAVTVVSTGGRTEEIEAIADRILALKAREPSLRWDDIAVLFRVADDYRDTVARLFTRRGIPFLFPRAPSVARHPLAQMFLRLASLSQRNFAADEVAELLASPWLRIETQDTRHKTQGSAWDRLIRQAGVVSGRSGWRDGLARLDRIVEPEDRVSFESLRVALDRLFALHDAKPENALVRDWIGWLGRLLAALAIGEQGAGDRRQEAGGRKQNAEGRKQKAEGGGQSKSASCLVPTASYPPQDAAAVQHALIGAVQSLWAVEGIVPRWTYEEMLGWLATAVEQQSTGWSLHGNRVLVADVMAARGLSFDIVFLAGMVEHGFPRQIGQDPFLMDWERRDLSERLETLLPPKRDRGYEEEKFLFYLAVRAAQRRLVLLYQRVDEEGKDRVPSYYLYEVKRLLGERLREETVPLSRLEAVEALPDNQLSRAERDAATLRRALRGQQRLPLASALLRDPQRPLLARALRGEERRWWSRALDEHDGVLRFSPADSFGEAKRAGPEQDSALTIVGQVLSPTRLEDYGRCPYLYMAKDVLRLEPLPEPTAELERRLVGNLYHDALYRFYTALRQEGFLPLLESRREELLARLRTIVQEVCAEFERLNPTGLPLLWTMEQEAIQANLATVVAADLARTDDFAPAYFEASFGQPVPEGADQTLSTDRPLEIRLGDDLVLRFRGRIDRIDVDAATRRARVFDYKSGKPKSLRLDQGEQFQLPLYLMAVEELLLSGHQVAEAVLWFIGDEKGRRAMTRVEWESGKLPVLEALRDYAGAIRRGIFFPYPGDHCRFCDFATICRKSPVSRLQRKYADSDAEWYVKLKEGA